MNLSQIVYSNTCRLHVEMTHGLLIIWGKRRVPTTWTPWQNIIPWYWTQSSVIKKITWWRIMSINIHTLIKQDIHLCSKCSKPLQARITHNQINNWKKKKRSSICVSICVYMFKTGRYCLPTDHMRKASYFHYRGSLTIHKLAYIIRHYLLPRPSYLTLGVIRELN